MLFLMKLYLFLACCCAIVSDESISQFQFRYDIDTILTKNIEQIIIDMFHVLQSTKIL